MKSLTVSVNGRSIRADVEPRTHLADFLRAQQSLTGTHIGCEHGVCGACTVLVDGSPTRSCITYAVACESAQVTTIEGLEEDPVIVDLREAFSAHHALQCGYCTPGMLISARDIITRLPTADEARIRRELSGNLCRCTGYVGIVAAVQAVLARRAEDSRPPVDGRRALGPVGAHPVTTGRPSERARREAATARAGAPLDVVRPEQWKAVESDGVELVQSFSVPFPREEVWVFLDDLDRVASCMPGARLTGQPRGGIAEGEVNVKLGPIVSAFAGTVEVVRDASQFRGTIKGSGRDVRSNSNARALIAYKLDSADDTTTRVDISVKFLLTGALAQFSRSGLIRDVAHHLTQVFAQNVENALSGRKVGTDQADVLDAGALARGALGARIRNFFLRLMGRR